MKESENVSDEGTSRNREEWKDAKHSIHSLVTSIDWSGIFRRKVGPVIPAPGAGKKFD
jgi:hypothetical protein